MTSIPQIWNSTKNAYEGINAFALSNVDGTNAMTSGQIYNLANLTRSICPSGCLTVGELDYTYMSTNPNKIKFLTENVALINGYKDTISATTITTINTPPLDLVRNDLVFREMYLDATTGIPTFKFRIMNGIDFITYPEGVNQTSLVKAQGSSSSDTSYTYSLSSTDKGLYVAGDGSNSAKTALGSLDGYSYAIPLFNIKRRPSCGYMSTNEYDKVSSLGNIALVKARSGQQRVSHSGDSVTTKIEGKTLVNLLGDAGNCEDLNKWDEHYTTLSTTQKLFGAQSFNINGGNYISKKVLCDQTHKYLVSSYVYISAYTSGSNILRVTDYNASTGLSDATFDSTKLNQWQRKSQIVTGKSGDGLNIILITSANTTLYADGIMLYDLTAIYGAGNEPTDIPTLERALPYVNGVKSASSVGVKSTGKNLFNIANPSRLNRSFGDYISGQTIRICTNRTYNVGSYYTFKLLPNTQYSFKHTHTLGGTATSNYSAIISATSKTDLHRTLSSDTKYTFTTPNDGIIQIEFARIGGGNDTLGWLDITNIQLEEGSSATAYESYQESQIITPSDIGDLKQIGAVKDDIVLQTGDWTKRVSDVVVLDGSQNWVINNSHADWYRVTLSTLINPLNIGSVSKITTTLNHKSIELPNVSTNDVTSEGCMLFNGIFYVNILHSDTGFVYGVSASVNEIKAYFYGYKMCNADGTTWDGTSTKYWKKITDGTGITSTLPTASYAGYTPYKMIYQLATPIVTNIRDKFDGRMYLNSGYNGIAVDNVSRIDGNVVSVPNLVTNGDFSNGTTGWATSNATISASNNVGSVTASAQYGYAGMSAFTPTVVGSKYYVSAMIKSISSLIKVGMSSSSFGAYSGSNNYEKVSVICTATTTNTHVPIVRDDRASGWDVANVMNMFSVNLTQTFGAGNEPSQAWCDQYLTFGTNYALYAPSLTTALKVVNDGGDKFNSVQGNVGIISANKYRSDKLYSLLYKLAEGDYTYPDISLTAGTVTSTIVNSASVGSITLADSDVPYKKNGDGAKLRTIVTITKPAIILGGLSQIDVSLGYTSITVGDYLWSDADNTSPAMKVISKDGSNKITILNVYFQQLGASTSSYYLMDTRVDKLLSDIVDTKDIQSLLHQVSLTGFSYDNLLTESFDRLIRNEA